MTGWCKRDEHVLPCPFCEFRETGRARWAAQTAQMGLNAISAAVTMVVLAKLVGEGLRGRLDVAKAMTRDDVVRHDDVYYRVLIDEDGESTHAIEAMEALGLPRGAWW